MFFVSMVLTIAAIICVSVYGLRLGADFKGGSVLELDFSTMRPDIGNVKMIIESTSSTAGISLNPAGEKGLIIRMNEIDEPAHQKIVSAIKEKHPDAVEKRFDSIGPAIGRELKNKSIQAIIVLLIAIVIYISIVFRMMKRVLSPWAMGVAAIVALLHDLIIPIGVFALLGHYLDVEIGAVFLAAALTILGYSVSDTVVVFDRVRENVLRMGSKEPFGVLVHKSVMQTLSRSINTSMTTTLALLAVYFFGGESVKYFALAMIIGIVCGSYSSIFVASPILMWWHKKRKVI